MADTIDVTQGAAFIPEIVANEALGMLEAELHLAKNVARDSEYTPVKEGDVVNISKRGALTANQKLAGQPVTLQNPLATTVPVSINQHWEVSFLLEDITQTLANGKIQIKAGYIADAIQTLGEKIEALLAAKAANLTYQLGTAAVNITDTVLRASRTRLSNSRAPKTNRFLYLEPDQIDVILNLDKFVNAEKYGSSMPVMEGEYGRIYGMKVFESLFTQSNGASPAGQMNMAFHRDALVLAMRPLVEPKVDGVQTAIVDKDGLMIRVIKSWNADYLGEQITIDCLFGVSTLRPEVGVRVLS